MVYIPKGSGDLPVWCIETAINLVFKAAKGIDNFVNRSDMKASLRVNAEAYGASDRQVSTMMYDLKRRNYVEYLGDSVRLTDKAKIKIIDKIIESEKKDGKYRLVSFDIPELLRRNRNNFRRALKRMGFLQLQKSLWVCDHNVGELVEIASKEYQVSEYVAYFVAEKSNIDKYVKKLFKDVR